MSVSRSIIVWPVVALVSSLSWALPSVVFAKDPWNQGVLSSLNLGLRYSSVLEARGATFYDHLQIDPVVGVFLFDDRLEFLGDSIGYRDFVAGRWLRARSRFSRLVDDPLFPRDDSKLGPSNSRPDTIEWTQSLEFFLPAYDEAYQAEIDLSYAQDIQAHHGQYFELTGKKKLFDFNLPLGTGLRIEPNAFFTLGWGSENHNRFLYGTGSGESGFNNIAYGLVFAFPNTADRFYPIVKVQGFSVLGNRRQGSLVQGHSDGVLLQWIATFGLLDP